MSDFRYSKEGLDEEHSLERESVTEGVRKYRAALDAGDPLSDMEPGALLIRLAVGPMSAAIKKFCKQKVSASANAEEGTLPRGKAATHAFLNQLPPDEIAFIATRRIINSLADDKASIQSVATSLAAMLKEQVDYNAFKVQHPGYLFRVEENLKQSTLPHRRRVITRAKNLLAVEAWSWSTERERLHIGMELLYMFAATVRSEKDEPLVVIEKARQVGGKKTALSLRPTEPTLKWIEAAHARCELLQPLYYPMVIKPKDWGVNFGGGFVSAEVFPGQNKLVKADLRTNINLSEKGRMPEVYSAVNRMQNTAWKINRRVFDVFDEIWRGGGELGGLPARELEAIPDRVEDATWALLGATEQKIHKSMISAIKTRNIKAGSKRIASALAWHIAEKFKDHPELYFVWSMDWRGRLYPIQSFINPQSNDIGRALIHFSKGMPLGEEGAFWLAVHGANCFGVDKVSFEDRVAWVNDNTEKIMDSASNPLDGARFWCDAEDPYQFLAFCFEWSEMTLAGRPVTYVSHLCVGMDGSCNGLQNFSALLRDPVGGAATNLIPSETPRDIYQEVANVLNRMVNEDAGSTDEKVRVNARIWQGRITRKVTKRGVMTTPYGSKRYGLRAQLHVELAKLDENYLEVEDAYPPINYLSTRLYEAIGEVVIAARQAMDWMQLAARALSKAELPIVWETPIGFPAIQNYRVSELKRVETLFGGTRYRVGITRDTEKIDKKRAANAISPNFIHSLDATHLMMTVNRCHAEGITDFGMIHDSYGVHAGHVHTLNRLLRETFIALYSGDVFEKFRQDIMAQLPNEEIPELPEYGDLDLSVVADSKYFFA